MTTLKSLTIVAVLLAGGTSLAMAQIGLPTGGQSPVAGGANGGGCGLVAGTLVVPTATAMVMGTGPAGICTPTTRV